MSESLATKSAEEGPRSIQRMSLTDMQTLAKLFFDSRMFKSLENVAQAFVKIKAGEEFGFGPFASMQAFNIIQGKVELSGDAQAHKIKASGKYDYRIVELTDLACEILFLEGQRELGKSRFTMEDAKKADLLKNGVWRSYPRNMLFNRALTNGTAWYCPDAMACRVYGEGEISGEPAMPEKEVIDIGTGELLTFKMPALETEDRFESAATVTCIDPKDVRLKTFTDKLKAKVSLPTPVAQMATALKARQEGWDSQGFAKHPLDDDEPAGDAVAAGIDSDAKMLAHTMIEAKKLIRLIFDEKGKDVCLGLINECFGRRPVALQDVETSLKDLSLGQLVDGVEALKQKRGEKR